MLEQCIYSRADNDYINGNGQRIGVGYGRMANSQGYLALPSNVQDTLTSYPGPVPDQAGNFPKVLSMYGLGSGSDAVQVLQQVVYLSSSSRDLHVGHQYAAQGCTDVYNMIVDPRAWMQVFFEDRTNTIDYPVSQCEKMPADIPFDMGTLPEVLKAFSMTLSHFEILLCSLFEVLRYESLFTLITVDDSKPNYPIWIRRLIAHIYMFLPLSMRRQLGFESWFTGRTFSGRVNLQFTGQSRLIADGHRRYVRIVRAHMKYDYDVTNCVLFAGGNVRFVPDPNYPMDITRISSYRRFIRPWLERAASRNRDGLKAELQLNRYWQIFDTAPDGKDACDLDAFESLITYEGIRHGTFDPEMNALPAFAADFYGHMGGYGGKILAKWLVEKLSDVDIDARAIDLLIDLSDEASTGPEVASCAASFLCGDRLGDIQVDIQHLKTLLHMITQGSLTTAPGMLQTLIKNAYSVHQEEGGTQLWADIRALLRIEAEEDLSDDVRTNVMVLCTRLLPERFIPGEAAAALNDAWALSTPQDVTLFTEAYLKRVQPDVEWAIEKLENLLRHCEPSHVNFLCQDIADRLLDAEALNIRQMVDLLETLCLLHSEGMLDHDTVEAIAQRSVGHCGFGSENEDAVVQELSRFVTLSQEYGFSLQVSRDVLSSLLGNNRISLARKLTILYMYMPESLEEPILLEYLRDGEAQPLPHGEVLPFAKMVLHLKDGELRNQAEVLLYKSLEGYVPELEETAPLIEVLSHYSAQKRSDFRTQLLNALDRDETINVFSASEALLSAFEADAASAEIACRVMERTVETWPVDDSTLNHIITCASLVEGGQALYAPLWERALARYVESVQECDITNMVASLRQFERNRSIFHGQAPDLKLLCISSTQGSKSSI